MDPRQRSCTAAKGRIIRFAKKQLSEPQRKELTPKGRAYYGLLAEGKCGKCGIPITVEEVKKFKTDKFPGAPEKTMYLAKAEKITFSCGHSMTFYLSPVGQGFIIGGTTWGTMGKNGVATFSSTRFFGMKREKRDKDELRLGRSFVKYSYPEYTEVHKPKPKMERGYDVVARTPDKSKELRIQITGLLTSDKPWRGYYADDNSSFKFGQEDFNNLIMQALDRKQHDPERILLIDTDPISPEFVPVQLFDSTRDRLRQLNFREVWLIGSSEKSGMVCIWKRENK